MKSSYKAGLEAARQRGVRLGAPSKISAELREQILNSREQGISYRAIAQQLDLSYGLVYKVSNEKDAEILE